MTDAFDIFISYAHADGDWVRVLAENLHQQGLQVFFDEWEIDPGDVLVHRLDKGILNSRNGILVVSPDSLSRPWVAEEYAAMIADFHGGKSINIFRSHAPHGCWKTMSSSILRNNAEHHRGSQMRRYQTTPESHLTGGVGDGVRPATPHAGPQGAVDSQPARRAAYLQEARSRATGPRLRPHNPRQG
jgi:hypothetical protein